MTIELVLCVAFLCAGCYFIGHALGVDRERIRNYFTMSKLDDELSTAKANLAAMERELNRRAEKQARYEQECG